MQKRNKTATPRMSICLLLVELAAEALRNLAEEVEHLATFRRAGGVAALILVCTIKSKKAQGAWNAPLPLELYFNAYACCTTYTLLPVLSVTVSWLRLNLVHPIRPPHGVTNRY
eukprot:1363283-Pyramimonas_sp.AAC.2